MSKLILLRHAQSVKNLKKIHGGQGEELTELGFKQIEEVAEKFSVIFANEPFRLFASTSRHTRYTAEVIAKIMGVVVEKPLEFKPLYLGVADGLSEQELEKMYPEVQKLFVEWRSGKIDIKKLIVPEMESYMSFWERGLNLLAHLPKNENCVLVCSNSLMILLAHCALNHHPEETDLYKHISIPNCGLICFDVADNKYILDSKNTNVDISK